MKQTITQKAESARDALDQAAVAMHRQMKSGELDKELADKDISFAQRKVKTWRNAYFARTYDLNHLPQVQEFHRSPLETELETANERFGRVLKHYAQTVGAEFQAAE